MFKDLIGAYLGRNASKLFICLLITSVLAVTLVPSVVQAQAFPYGLKHKTLYQKAETTVLGGSSTGFVMDTANPAGTGTAEKMFIYKLVIVDCNSTANSFTFYNAKTYTIATLNNDVLWNGDYDNSTVTNGGSDFSPAAYGATRFDLKDLPYTIDFTDGNGNPTEVDGALLKPTNGSKRFTAVLYYKLTP